MSSVGALAATRKRDEPWLRFEKADEDSNCAQTVEKKERDAFNFFLFVFVLSCFLIGKSWVVGWLLSVFCKNLARDSDTCEGDRVQT